MDSKRAAALLRQSETFLAGLRGPSADLLRRYAEEMKRSGYSLNSRMEVVRLAAKFLSGLRKPLSTVAPEDVDVWVRSLRVAPATLESAKWRLRRFLGWAGCGEEVLRALGERPRPSPATRRPWRADRMFTERHWARNEAIRSLVAELDLSPADARHLKVGDVVLAREGWFLRVRRYGVETHLPLHRSVPLLSFWLNQHPDRENPGAPLWVDGEGRPMDYAKLWRALPGPTAAPSAGTPPEPAGRRRSPTPRAASGSPEEAASGGRGL